MSIGSGEQWQAAKQSASKSVVCWSVLLWRMGGIIEGFWDWRLRGQEDLGIRGLGL